MGVYELCQLGAVIVSQFPKDVKGLSVAVHKSYDLQRTDPMFGLINMIDLRGRVSCFVSDIERFAELFEEITGAKVSWTYGPVL